MRKTSFPKVQHPINKKIKLCKTNEEQNCHEMEDFPPDKVQ